MLAHDVMNRLQNSINLHAADCQYHLDCYQKLIKKKASTCTKVSNHETSFNILTEQMLQQESHIWNSVEVFNTYVGLGGSHSRKSLITELQSHFGKHLIVMHVSGCASIIGFQNHIPYKLQLVDDDQDDESVDNLVSKIKQESSVLPGISNYDLSQFTLDMTVDNTSPTLLDIVSKLVSGGVINKQSVSLAQSIQQHVNKQWNQTTSGVAVSLHHKFWSKELLSMMYDLGFIASYTEVLWFRSSVAKYTGEKHWNMRVYRLTEGWLVPGLITMI